LSPAGNGRSICHESSMTYLWSYFNHYSASM
jgi:hypothetical protein